MFWYHFFYYFLFLFDRIMTLSAFEQNFRLKNFIEVLRYLAIGFGFSTDKKLNLCNYQN